MTAIFLFVQFIFYPFAFFFWFIVFQPIRLFRKKLYYSLLDKLYIGYCYGIGVWNDMAGHSVYYCGDNIDDVLNDDKIIIANHQSLADISVICRILHKKCFRFEKAMWVMDWIMQFLPFGLVCYLHGDFFILQPSDVNRYSFIFGDYLSKKKAAQDTTMRTSIQNNFFSNNFHTITLFPEGGLLSKRKAASQKFAKKNGYPVLNNIVLPRAGGFINIVNSLRIDNEFSENLASSSAVDRGLKWIVDLTIAYPNSSFNLLEHFLRLSGKHQKIIINCKIFAWKDIRAQIDETNESQQLKDWLFQKFYEKEQLLNHFYQEGCFPSQEDNIKLAPKISWSHVLFLHVCCISTLLAIVLMFLVFI